ncbi:hypothetical protein Mal64_16700 [Pseudobythopirellula maris]|uniref:Uncharacterized protein n=1 Tax=Pseudobythopirellula maris TaxID=2527991 RepID=A0A5C5ZMW1_9BACT|nr:hypothetical protein [Pseudobythopirellula maris]TWT88191.1 hypothetical protein Mal64_16700 [Pseudobythopirellula maris]
MHDDRSQETQAQDELSTVEQELANDQQAADQHAAEGASADLPSDDQQGGELSQEGQSQEDQLAQEAEPQTDQSESDQSPPTATIDPLATADAAGDGELEERHVEASGPFVGRWNTLVSTTNWEKGRIIADWRSELQQAGASPAESSDEAWARLVGDVTSQHVGRLRRVHERFGQSWGDYEGLYWSHFLAALDWQDAEMWLEGALQNRWSVSKMRVARWEAVGAPGEEQPSDSNVVQGEIDGEAFAAANGDFSEANAAGGADGEEAGEREPRDREETADSAGRETQGDESTAATAPAEERPAPVRPFEKLGELPDDVAEAFESFKLAIVAHKLTDWSEISRSDLLGALDALKTLAMAPSEA